MKVISLSVDERTLRRMDALQETVGFQGRSELVRTAVEALEREKKDVEALEGRVEAVIVARHHHRGEGEVSDIAHDHEETITTQLHWNLSDDRCVEVFYVEGEAGTVREFYNGLKRSRATDSVILLPQNEG